MIVLVDYRCSHRRFGRKQLWCHLVVSSAKFLRGARCVGAFGARTAVLAVVSRDRIRASRHIPGLDVKSVSASRCPYSRI